MTFEADTAPLADALRKIGQILDRSESDADQMTAMLHDIADAVAEGRKGYLAEVSKAQDAEIAHLRALAKKEG